MNAQFNSWHDRQFFAPLDKEEELQNAEDRAAQQEARACDMVDAIMQ